MNLKKIFLGLVLAAFITIPAFAAAEKVPTINDVIALYKAKNYVGCIQSSFRITDKNPSNIYAQYYKAISFAQLGKKDLAIYYFEKVEALNSSPIVVKNAQKAKACLTSAEECAKFDEVVDEFDSFIKSNKFYEPKVQSEINQKKLDRIRQEINEDVKNIQKTEAPTNEEIANAVKTLAKVGFNPMGAANMFQSPEMAQMNMLLGDSSTNNSYNNMLPYLLMSQNQNGNSKISPELVQTMMMSQMNLY